MNKSGLPKAFYFFLGGAFISNLGTWVQFVAQGWLIAELSQDPFWSGFIGFCSGLPLFIFSFYSGTLADQLDRRKVLFLSQSVLLLVTTCAAVLIYAHAVTIWSISLLAFVAGVATAVTYPAYNGFIYDIVGKDNLGGAVKINALQIQLSRVFGPILAGILIGEVGVGACFVANAFSFLAMIVVVKAIAIPYPQKKEARSSGALQNGVSVVEYIGNEKSILLVLLCTALTAVFMAPQIALLPLFVKQNMGLGSASLSSLWFSSAVGSVSATLLLSITRNSSMLKGIKILFPSALAGISLLGFSLVTNILLAHLFIFMSGFSISCVSVLGLVQIQTVVLPDFRGRIVGLWIMLFQGMFPVGNLIAGELARWTSISFAWIGASMLLVLSSFVLWAKFRKIETGVNF